MADIAIMGTDYSVIGRPDGTLVAVLGGDNTLIRLIVPSYPTVTLILQQSTPVHDEDVVAIAKWNGTINYLIIRGSDDFVYKLSQRKTPVAIMNFTLSRKLFAKSMSLQNFVQTQHGLSIDASELSDAEISKYVADNKQYVRAPGSLYVNGKTIVYSEPSAK